jgi:hypothetical protein
LKAGEHKQGTAVKSEGKGTMMNKLWPLPACHSLPVNPCTRSETRARGRTVPR